MATILIVDDREANREFLVTLLGYGGHHLLEASDGAGGLALTRAERPDLVIADVLMPTMDGYEFVRRLRADPDVAGTRVIFYTAHYHEPEARRLALACGVVDVLTKPCEPETVLRTVAAALGDAPAAGTASAPVTEGFDREHLHLLTDKLSQQVDELSRTNERLTRLVELGLQLGSERVPARLLQNFCDGIREIIGARHAVVGVFNGGYPSYRYFLLSGMAPEAAARVAQPGPFAGPLGRALGAGRCFRAAVPEDLAARGVPAEFPPATAVLAAPVVSPARVHGWVCLFDKVGGAAFTDEDERFAQMLGAQAGRIYENGSLYADLLQQTEALAQEVTERERAEAEARRAGELLRAVADGTTDAVFVKDREGKYLLFNEAAARFVGKPVAEVLGKDDLDLFEPEGARAVMARDRRVMASAAVETDEEVLTAAGVTRTYQAMKAPYRDAAGAVAGVIGISRDISDRKRAEQRLQTQHAVVSILAESEDLRAAAPRLLQALCGATGWAVGDIWVMNRQDVLACVDVWPSEDETIGEFRELSFRTTFAPGVGLPGRVWATRQPVWIPNLATEPDFARAAAAERDGLSSGFGFPARARNEVLGVAEFFSRESRPPDSDTLRMFDSLGSQIGQFIDRKRSEEGLRLFRALLDQTTDGIEVVDPETGRFLDVNERTCAVHGYTRAEYLSLCAFDVDPRVAAKPWTEVVRERRAGTPTFESEHRRKDGTVFPVEVNLNFIRVDREYMVSVVRDVTDRRRTEEALRDAQQRLEHVVASSPSVLLTMTVRDRQLTGISWISANLREVLGHDPREALDPAWWVGSVHPDDRERVSTEIQADLLARGHAAMEYRFRHGDGAYRWTRGEIRLVRNGAGEPTEAVGAWSDITEFKLLEEQFRQAQKMEAVGRLAGGIAHDFNNLLTVINGYGEIVLSGLPAEDPNRGPLQEMVRAGERAARLTRQLLAFSRKAIIEPTVLDLSRLVADVERMLERIVGEDIHLAIAAAADLGLVRADAGQLEQVILNLVVNARDAMPTGGHLTIETRNADLDETYTAVHSDARPGHHVLLAVTDTGCGMSAETVARIFEPFFSTKGERGTGLGLATVYGIVKQSGGHIGVYSEVGRGTTFKVYLPRVSGSAEARLRPSPGAVPRGGETLLLVEDEDGVRALTRQVLRDCGYTVLDTRDGPEAVRIAREHPGRIDLLVTDVVLPRMGGREVAQLVRERHPGLKVLFVSGYTDDAVVRHGILEAEVAFLQKPFTRASLASKVRAVLDG